MENTVLDQSLVPSGKTEAVAQFNRTTRELTAILMTVPDYRTLNQEDYVYHEIQIDFNSESIVGTADCFEIKANADLPKVVYEENLDIDAQTKTIKAYPLMYRVALFGQAVKRISDQLGIPQPELQTMLDFITGVDNENTKLKEFYRLSPDHIYKSYADTEGDESQLG